MKNTFFVSLLLVLATACGAPYQVASTPIDPCDQSYFNATMCQQAIAANGYYYQGTFVPLMYSHPYTFYYGGYNTYVSRGGRIRTVSPSYYSRSYVNTNRSSTVRTYSTPPRTTYSSPRTTYSSPRTTYSSPRSSSSSSSGYRRRR